MCNPQSFNVQSLVLLWALAGACGGGGSGPSRLPAPPSPSPSPATHPCDAALGVLDPIQITTSSPAKGPRVDDHGRWRVLDDLWTHRAATSRDWLRPLVPQLQTIEVGEVAVLQDQGDIILPPNRLDLAERGVRFTRNTSSGYDLMTADATFRQPLGTRLTLSDDDGVEQAMRFGFSFFGVTHQSAFVNSDGNLTFGTVDKASTERNVARLLSGPPRVAPFLADLDPSAGGAVFVHSDAGAFTVTWCRVRGFDVPESTTFQVTLLADTSIEIRYASGITLGDAVVGVSPGQTSSFTPVDLSAGPVSGGTSAVGERFAARAQIDNVSLARKFYAGYGDLFDQLLVWTDTSYVQDAFAYETTVANEIRGIGLDLYDLSREYGSAGRLRSYVMMDSLAKYPADPAEQFFGENTTLSLIGQEVGHRWLVFFNFLDHNRQVSDAFLGRDDVHWSFFMDSDASVMEGNDIEDRGGGSFMTRAAVKRFSLLDQYAMGLVSEREVPVSFYVANPTNVQPARDRESAPRVGVAFNGTRRDVLIQDIIAVHGPRVPAAAEAPRVHRQAFIYLVSAGKVFDQAQAAKVDRFRQAWETFFQQATDGRMKAETRIR